MIDAFTASPWPGLVLWTGLYISDYALTIACARLYQAGVRERIRFEGSYEITPYYQADIDALRMFSPRFLVALIVNCVLQGVLWRMTMGEGFSPELYQVALGAMILSQLTIHVRHLRNYFLFRAVLAGRGISGRIEYGRVEMLKQSAVELGAFAILYGVTSAITRSWFVFGGALACAALTANHRMLAAKQESSPRTAAQEPGRMQQPAAPGGGTP